jgi:hypothetical protein
MTRRGALLLLLGLAAPAFAGERYCPKGLVAYETRQPGSPYICVKPQARALPAPDMTCPSKAQLEKIKVKLRSDIDRPSCDAELSALSSKPLDCYDLRSIRNFKSLLLARVTGDDEEAEAIAKSLCPLTAPLACMNPEPQCRTRAPLPNLTPWRRPWDEQDLADVAKFFRKLLPISAKQADTLAERYKRNHPGYWTVDDVDD